MLLRSITKHVKDQNWFAVALDFFIVVVGVGVAMVGQQWLSDRQQRADMAMAEIALQTDLINNYLIAEERLAVAQCRKEAYQAIAAQLLESGESWTPMPRANTDTVFETALPVVFRSPSRNWGSRIWQAELARGTFNQMADERRDAFDGLFKQARYAEKLQDDIYTLQGQLKILAVATTISQSERRRYYDALGEMDDKSGLLELIAGQIIYRIETIGIDGLQAENIIKGNEFYFHFRNDFNGHGQSVYGACLIPTQFSLIEPYLAKEETK